MFLRTVKLKDFPWNGWLQLGLEATRRCLEPNRRFHRPVRPPHVVRRRRSRGDTHALRLGLDAQPLLRLHEFGPLRATNVMLTQARRPGRGGSGVGMGGVRPVSRRAAGNARELILDLRSGFGRLFESMRTLKFQKVDGCRCGSAAIASSDFVVCRVRYRNASGRARWQEMAFTARAAGRFPIEIHAR